MNKLNISWDKYKEAFEVLLNKIQESNNNFDLIISISRGGNVIATNLSYRLDVGLISFDPKHQNIKDLNINPNLNILLVDDINDTGYTLSTISDNMLDLGINNVKLCVLINRHTSIIKPEYYVLEVSKDYDWVNFPWEVKI